MKEISTVSSMVINNCEVRMDEKTVWVNCGRTGCALGRFSPFGIDVHRAPEEQDTKGACLACTHSKPTFEDWRNFLALMQQQHGVNIPSYFMPSWVFRSSGRPPQARQN